MEFLAALADQAAIAIDNAALFRDLQRFNQELGLAYETTLEGWSRALDLRDRETEGHTRRVTELTLRLAHALGVKGGELIHIRRGALLHDIGKMGIPDSILLKPGPLTEEEWTIMRRHPGYAYELLTPITFLRPALTIPYYHHERWDGSGYPHGLRGTDIPWAARIFAVVDVWDALCSDRPYRAAWPAAQVRAHLQALAGVHFDPEVVTSFLGNLLRYP
jgi:HD-GYP domain-containing protein (c-di-GMP phosphodiesterase class II)